MVNRILVACLSFLAISAQAQVVSFSTTQFDVTAIALSDAAPDVQSFASPPDPVIASAASVGADVATAGAFATLGLFSTSADATSASGIASAVATSHFVGSFLSGGSVLLGIDFMASDFASGTGNGGSTLFVSLVSGGTTLFSDYLSGGSRLFAYNAAPGTLGTLELTLTSEANAGFLSAGTGNFSSSGLVSVTTPVPEPQTCVLLLIGLFVIRQVVVKRAA